MMKVFVIYVARLSIKMCKDPTEDTTSESGSKYGLADNDSHPSLGLTLQEIRNLYEDEEERRRTIETKIGVLISINAIVIAIVGSFEGINSWWSIAVISTALISALSGLIMLWPREYQRPGPENIDDIFGDAQKAPSDFEIQFINDYRSAIKNNESKNNNRYRIFKFCAILTFISIAIIFISQIPFSNISQFYWRSCLYLSL